MTTFAEMAADAMGDDDDTDTDNVIPIREVTDSEAAMLHSGQSRMAYRMAVLFRDRLLFVHSVGWHYWDGQRWAEDDKGKARRSVLQTFRQALRESVDLEGEARDILRKDVRKCESATGVQGVLTLAASLEAFAATVKDLDADPYLLNVANGTLDLRTMELRPHDPADRITKVTRAAWDLKATGPEWRKFLARILPNEPVAGFLMRYLGTALCGTVLEHKLAILTGTGRNGKGVLYGAVLNALGDYASSADPNLFMHREGAHPTGEMDLRGRRFVVVSESDKDKKLAEATVKRLTGGDMIKARYMRENFVEFPPSHTAALVTNHLPKVSGDDPALWARLRVVPFDVVIPDDEQDGHLPEKLQLEADAVLLSLVYGWEEYQRDGLAEPEEVTEATWSYQKDSDAYTRFVEEQCHRGASLQRKKSEVWERWQKWAKAEGVDALSQKALAVAFERMGLQEHRGGKGVRYWKGIDLLPDELDDNEHSTPF